MRKLVVAAAVFAIALGASQAMAQGNTFKLYFGAAYVQPTTSSIIDGDEVEAIGAPGWNVGFEWRFVKLLGLDIDYLQSEHDVEVEGVLIGATDFRPLTASLNFHLVRGRFFNLYLGPSLSYVSWSDLELNPGGQILLGEPSVKLDSDFAWGVQIGADFSLIKLLAIGINLRYQDLDATPQNGDALAVSPVTARVYLALRF